MGQSTQFLDKRMGTNNFSLQERRHFLKKETNAEVGRER